MEPGREEQLPVSGQKVKLRSKGGVRHWKERRAWSQTT